MFSLCQPQPPSSLSTQVQGKLLLWRWPPLRAHGAAPAPRDAARTQGLRLSRAGGSQIRKSFTLRGNQSFLPRVCRGSQGCRSRCCNFAMQTAQPLPWGSRWVEGEKAERGFCQRGNFQACSPWYFSHPWDPPLLSKRATWPRGQQDGTRPPASARGSPALLPTMRHCAGPGRGKCCSQKPDTAP